MSDVAARLHLGEPSRRSWRQLCAELDRVGDATAAARVPELEDRLSHWPARLRSAPGRWLARVLAGQRVPSLALARHATLTCFGETAHVDRLAWADAPELDSLETLEVYDDLLDNQAIVRLIGRGSASLHSLRLCAGVGRPTAHEVGIDDLGVERLIAWPGPKPPLTRRRSHPIPAEIALVAAFGPLDLVEIRPRPVAEATRQVDSR